MIDVIYWLSIASIIKNISKIMILFINYNHLCKIYRKRVWRGGNVSACHTTGLGSVPGSGLVEFFAVRKLRTADTSPGLAASFTSYYKASLRMRILIKKLEIFQNKTEILKLMKS